MTSLVHRGRKKKKTPYLSPSPLLFIVQCGVAASGLDYVLCGVCVLAGLKTNREDLSRYTANSLALS